MKNLIIILVTGFICVVLMMVGGIVGALYITDDSNQDKPFVKSINNLFTADSIDSDDAYSDNEMGLDLMDQGNYEEAIVYFESALDKGVGQDVAYNNLSWAYNELEDYERGLEYAKLAYAIDDSDYIQEINYGNALFGLGKYEEALEHFEHSLAIEDDNLYGLYGKASTHFELGNYQLAETIFEDYFALEKDDDVAAYLIDCYFFQEKDEEAWDFLRNEANGYSEDVDYHLYFASYLYDYGEYTSALEYFLELNEIFPNNYDILEYLGLIYGALGDYDLAIEYANASYDLMKTSSVLTTLGHLYYDLTEYSIAAEYYYEAYNLSEDDYNLYDNGMNLLYAYYVNNRYTKAIETGLTLLDQGYYDVDLLYMLAYSYNLLAEYDTAAYYFKLCVEENDQDIDALYALASNYFYDGDFENAKLYANKILGIDSTDYSAQYIIDDIATLESTERVIVDRLIEDYYLYYTGDSYTQASEPQESHDFNYLAEYFYSKINPDDAYSFMVVHDGYYDDSETSIHIQPIGLNDTYIDIDYFDEDTDDKFIEYIDSLQEPENHTFYIDLRDNYGGLTQSAINMLDTLLDEVTLCNLIYRDGYTESYYSSADQVQVKEIVIYINNNSASASELLTQGLTTYLSNVTIKGQQSHGKGVGQVVISDMREGYSLYIVNHFWNVREKNIHEVGIAPDIEMNNEALETEINNLLTR